MSLQRAWMAWSSGKDSAWAFHVARARGDLEIVKLFVVITEPFDRVSMHGVRTNLVRAQARCIGLPLEIARIPYPCSDEAYAEVMKGSLTSAREQGVNAVVFGDLFLEDVRAYREEQMAKMGMAAVFPLWQSDTNALSLRMIASGLRSLIICVDPRQAPERICGQRYDENFLKELPPGMDPCGERGEFHTFAYDGPMFDSPIAVRQGEKVNREGFWFVDLLAEEDIGD